MAKHEISDLEVEIKPSQCEQLLERLLRSDDAESNILIVGSPGLGKTSIVEQVTERLGYDLLISHPVVSDPTDVKGLPFVVESDGISCAEWLPFGDLKQMITAEEPLVVFLDDLGQAPPVVQAAFMQLLLARKINQHAVSPHVRFIAATNRKSDKAGVGGVLEPVKSRFRCILHLTSDYKDWTKWAINHNMPAELVAFINRRPEMLDKFEPMTEIVNTPCPRTVANVGHLMNIGLPEGLEHAAFSGAAGTGFAGEFQGFLRVYRDMPDPAKVLDNPEMLDVAKISEKPDVIYALCAGIAYAIKDDDRLTKNFVTFMNMISEEYAVMALRLASTKIETLRNNKHVIEWITDHTDMLV